MDDDYRCENVPCCEVCDECHCIPPEEDCE
jgi:hypothetical protein